MLQQLLQDLDFRASVGWALLHSIWQGVIVWSLYAVVRFCGARPAVRFHVGHACLFAFVVMQLATLVYVVVSNARPAWLDGFPAVLQPPLNYTFDESQTHYRLGSLPDDAGWLAWTTTAEPYLRIACMLWLAGLCYRAFLGAGAFFVLNRELKRCLPIAEPLASRARELADRLNIRTAVRFLECDRLTVPATTGWLKPVVLIPAASILNLSPYHLEALITHELAHIARRDFLAHTLRSCLQSIYFFHPLIGWMCRQLSEDAEEATDEIAAFTFGDRKGYAEALVTLEERRDGKRRLLGADGGTLKARLLNLLANRQLANRHRLRLSAAGPLVTAMLVILLFSQSIAVAAEERSTLYRVKNQTLCETIVNNLSTNRDNPQLVTALEQAIISLRHDGKPKPAELSVLAVELNHGVNVTLLEDLTGVPAHIKLQREVAPSLCVRFGTPEERRQLIELLDMQSSLQSTSREMRRQFARAALLLSSLGNVPGNQQSAGRLIANVQFQSRLDLNVGQRRRLQMAVGAESHRHRDCVLHALQFKTQPPTEQALIEFIREVSLLPRAQTSLAETLSIDVHEQISALVHSGKARVAPDRVTRILRVGETARKNSETYTPKRIHVGPVPPVPPLIDPVPGSRTLLH